MGSKSDLAGSLGPLVDCLEEVPTLRDVNGRRLCLDLLSDRLGGTLPVGDMPNTRAHLLNIAMICWRRNPLGLAMFVSTVEQLEPHSIPVKRARAIVDDMAAKELLTEPDRQELLTLLVAWRGANLTEFVRAAGGPLVAHLGEYSPAEAVATLQQLNAGPDDLPPLLLFVEHVAAACDDELAKALYDWNDRQAELMGLTEKIAALRGRPVTVPGPNEVTAYLVLRIEPHQLDADRFVVVHWQHNDAAGWRPQRGESFVGGFPAVRAHVAALVEQAEAEWAAEAAEIRIEFLLPFSLLNEPVDQWEMEPGSSPPRPIGVHYAVVVRSLDRARAPQWHREWRRRWAPLKHASVALAAPDEHWLWSEGSRQKHLAVLDAKLAERRKVASLVLHSAPSGAEPGEVLVGIRTGIPVMIWHRADTAHSAFKNELSSLCAVLPDLVEHLRLLRSRAKQASRSASHPGNRVSLLWDDPYRPVEPVDPPSIPIEEVAAR